MDFLRPWLLPAMAFAVGIMTVAATWLVAEWGARPAIIVRGVGADATIVVAVEGAVATPGVHALPADARVQHAILAAGGLRVDADVGDLNLAARLSDEEQLFIPSKPAVAATASDGMAERAAASMAVRSDVVDINRATVAELDRLPGIGPVLADRIVEFRETNGPYGRIEELARVEGISAKMVEELRDAIVAGP